jgi:hypothetical protein
LQPPPEEGVDLLKDAGARLDGGGGDQQPGEVEEEESGDQGPRPAGPGGGRRGEARGGTV